MFSPQQSVVEEAILYIEELQRQLWSRVEEVEEEQWRSQQGQRSKEEEEEELRSQDEQRSKELKSKEKIGFEHEKTGWRSQMKQ